MPLLMKPLQPTEEEEYFGGGYNKDNNNNNHNHYNHISDLNGNGNHHIDMDTMEDHENHEEEDKMAIPPSYNALEDSLSKGLLKLSLTDRNAVEEEIHGVRCLGVTQETPELLQRSLHDFNRELLMIKNSPSRIAKLHQKQRQYDYQLRKILHHHHASTAASSTSGSGPKLNNIIGPPMDVLKNVIDETPAVGGTPDTLPTAQQKHQCYLNDPDVRLRFLRCENFDAKAAAKRFCNFFDLCQEVFGDSVAERPIRLSDFMDPRSLQAGGGSSEPRSSRRSKRYSQHEKKAFANSRIQYLPFRDRSGRRVKVGVGECNSDLDLQLRIKINLLLDWIASEDVETQQKGVVIVVWPSEPPTPSTATASSGASSCSSGTSSGSETEDEQLNQWEHVLRPKYTQNAVAYHKRYYLAQPLRVAAMHWCSQDKPIYRLLNSLYYFSLDSKSQARYKVHFGEPLEIRYSLQAYGIPVDLLPLTHTMALKRQNHSQWITCRKHVEDQQQKQEYQQYYQHQQYQHQQQFSQQTPSFGRNFWQQPWDNDEQALQFFDSYAGPGGLSSVAAGPPVVVECPRSYDVIIGKAKVCTNNPGNGFYSSLIEATHDEHDSMVNARDKVAMTWRILLHITEERKGRFLDWNKSLNAWVVIQDKVVIRKKIANSYKEYKRSRYVTTRSSSSQQQYTKKHTAPPTSDDDENLVGDSETIAMKTTIMTSSTLGANGTKSKSSETEKNGYPIVNANNRDNTKRRKITGCLGNACGGESEKQKESMFAGL